MAVTNYYTVNGEILGEHTVSQSRLDYLPDALGSVTGAIDQTLTVQATARYKPYGADLASIGKMPVFGWVGRAGYRSVTLPHAESYVRLRSGSTEDGRWTTADPLWPFERAYAYCDGNPASRTDPSGLQQPQSTVDIGNRLFGKACENQAEGAIQRAEAVLQRVQELVALPPCATPFSRDQAIDCFAELLARLDRSGAVRLFVEFKYGKCCGLKLRCNAKTSYVVDCLDWGCANHDGCLATIADYMNRDTECRCNATLCAAAKACNCKTSPAPLHCAQARDQVINFYCTLIPTLLGCP